MSTICDIFLKTIKITYENGYTKTDQVTQIRKLHDNSWWIISIGSCPYRSYTELAIDYTLQNFTQFFLNCNNEYVYKNISPRITSVIVNEDHQIEETKNQIFKHLNIFNNLYNKYVRIVFESTTSKKVYSGIIDHISIFRGKTDYFSIHINQNLKWEYLSYDNLHWSNFKIDLGQIASLQLLDELALLLLNKKLGHIMCKDALWMINSYL